MDPKLQAENEKIKRLLSMQQSKFERLHDMRLTAEGLDPQVENLRFNKQIEDLNKDMALLHERGALTSELKSQFREAEVNTEVSHSARMIKIARQKSDGQIKWEQLTGKMKPQLVTGSMNEMFGALSTGSKKMFQLQKPISIASALIDMPTHISKTMSKYPYPWSIAMGALAGAASLAQINAIRSASFGGGGGGARLSNGGGGFSSTGGTGTPRLPAPTVPNLQPAEKAQTIVNITISGDVFRQDSEQFADRVAKAMEWHVNDDHIFINGDTAQAAAIRGEI